MGGITLKRLAWVLRGGDRSGSGVWGDTITEDVEVAEGEEGGFRVANLFFADLHKLWLFSTFMSQIDRLHAECPLTSKFSAACVVVNVTVRHASSKLLVFVL